MDGKSQGHSKLQKQNSKQQTVKQNKEPPNKRTHSEISNDSMGDIAAISVQLDEMTSEISKLRNDLVTKDDIENLITGTITSIFQTFEEKIQKEIKEQIKSQCQHLYDRIDCIQFEKKVLEDKLTSLQNNYEKDIKDLKEKMDSNEIKSMEAIKMANFNEQYSRKTNFKIMDVKEDEDETEERLREKVDNILKGQGVRILKEEVLAIHRIPTKIGRVRPVLLKTVNSNVKSRVMQKRKAFKTAGHRVTDDVTRLNTGLINRLFEHEQIDSAWFFNGSVFGFTHRRERIKFDIYDNITQVITDYRGRKGRH